MTHRFILSAAASLAVFVLAPPASAQHRTGADKTPAPPHCPVPYAITVDVPRPGPHPGRCFARVRVAPAYETYSERVMVRPARREQRTAPAVYAWAERRVLVEPVHMRRRVVPAAYRTVTESVVISPATTRVDHTAPVYETITEQVVSRPAHSEWRRSFVSPDEPLPRGAREEPTGEVICLVEVPAEYATIQRRVLREPGHDIETTFPAVIRQVTRQVIERPARVEDVPIPATYRTERYRRLVTPARMAWADIPPVYSSRQARRQTSAGRLAWRAIDCARSKAEPTPK